MHKVDGIQHVDFQLNELLISADFFFSYCTHSLAWIFLVSYRILDTSQKQDFLCGNDFSLDT